MNCGLKLIASGTEYGRLLRVGKLILLGGLFVFLQLSCGNRSGSPAVMAEVTPSIPVVAEVKRVSATPTASFVGGEFFGPSSNETDPTTGSSVAATAVEPPALPLRAWTVAPDGPVFGLDAANSLYHLAPDSLTPLAKSAPLFEISPDSPPDLQKSYLLADQAHLFVGSWAVTRTFVLSRTDFSPITTLDRVGPMAVDSGRWLLLASQHPESLISRAVIWRYNLADWDEPPRQIVEQSCVDFSDLKTDSSARRLVVRTEYTCASPPHRRQFYTIYDLDTMAEIGRSEPQLGTLARPALAAEAGLIATTLAAKSGFFYANRLLILNREGQEIKSHQPLDGVPAIDAAGQWLYLLRRRGLWVLRGETLSLQSIRPFTQTAPADLALSPDGQQLYLFGKGRLDSLPVAELQTGGIPTLSPFPAGWTHSAGPGDAPSVLPARLYRAAADPDFGLIQVGSFTDYFSETEETYRTVDGGQSWHFLVDLTYPDYQNLSRLSFSPHFAADRTIVAYTGTGLARSTDGGETWKEWTSPIAFVSEREGNRELYSISQTGAELRRLTDSPAVEENPAWSPAWTRLAFQSDRPGNWDIFSLRADCQDPTACDLRQLTDDPGDDLLPAWSPDGRWIAFVSTRDGNPEIYLMEPDGKNQRRLTFNPTGDWRPAWLPDSRHLVFTSNREGSNDIYKLAIPPLEAGPLRAEPEMTAVVNGPADDRDPAVDSSNNLLFLSDRDGTRRVYRLNLKDPYGRPWPATQTDHPESHPSPVDDSSYTILVAVEQAGDSNIYRVVGSESRPVAGSPAFDGQPAWGPVLWNSIEPVPAQGRLR